MQDSRRQAQGATWVEISWLISWLASSHGIRRGTAGFGTAGFGIRAPPSSHALRNPPSSHGLRVRISDGTVIPVIIRAAVLVAWQEGDIASELCIF